MGCIVPPERCIEALTAGTCECDHLEMRSLQMACYIRFSCPGVGWALNPTTGVLRRRDTEGRWPCDNKARDWSGAAANQEGQGLPAAPRSWERPAGPSPKPSEGACPCRHLDFQLPGFRTVRSPFLLF